MSLKVEFVKVRLPKRSQARRLAKYASNASIAVAKKIKENEL